MAVNTDAVPAGTPLAGRASAGARSPGRPSRWQRFRSAITGPAVLFALIWQIFLIYPVLAVVPAGASTTATGLGLVSIVAFAGIHLAAFASPAVTEGYPLNPPGRRGGGGGDDPPGAAAEQSAAPLGLGYLTGLVLCAAGTFPAAGLGGPLTFLPFIACVIAAAWPPRWSIPASAALIAVGVAVALRADAAGMLVPAFLVIPVVLSMLGTRIAVGVSDREDHYRRALDMVEERERVARDLHDVLGHTLTALTIRAQLARAKLDADPDAARGELANIEDLTRTALSEMRQTVAGMRVADPGRELAGLTASLRSAGMDVVVVGTPSLVPPSKSALVAWTLREAGTNIARHSAAGRVTVEFTPNRVRITDDGAGIDARRRDTPGPPGQGLDGLADRAGGVGARLAVRDLGPDPAASSTGTVVEVEWA